MITKLGPALRQFFQTYLRNQRALSPNTIKSYRDTFKLLISFIRAHRRMSRQLTITDLDVKTILAFLEHLEDKEQGRGNSVQTRNQRLAGIQAFFHYLSLHDSSCASLTKRVLAIPMKRAFSKPPDSLNRQELNALLAQPDISTADGLRDLAILTFLYNTGSRAQEVADLRISWFDFPQRNVTIIGKGQKSRTTPLWPSTVRLIKLYQKHHRRKPKSNATDYFFINQRGGHFTRFGIRALVKKYIHRAVKHCVTLQDRRLSTHSLRHTTAVHLLESKVDPNVIKAWLGHASIKSTDQYLDTHLEYKRQVLEQFGPPDYVQSSTVVQPDDSPDKILDWLDDL